MKIPPEIRSTYSDFDPEANFFLDFFDESPGKLLEVGAHDAPIAQMIAQSGHTVTSVDLRPHDHELATNHTHIVADFNHLSNEFWAEHRGTFDTAISVSAIEHFGLAAYTHQETGATLSAPMPVSDILACYNVYQLLRKDGVFYVTLPYGGRYMTNFIHWRVYSWHALIDRIIQDNYLEEAKVRICEDIKVGGNDFKAGADIDFFTASCSITDVPSISILLKMRKIR